MRVERYVRGRHDDDMKFLGRNGGDVNQITEALTVYPRVGT